jgi:hypothetical protein
MKCKYCVTKLPEDMPHECDICFDCLIGLELIQKIEIKNIKEA